MASAVMLTTLKLPTSWPFRSATARCAALSTTAGPSDTGRDREVAVGIDLGTTNSCVALMEGGKPVCVPLGNGAMVLPSVVAFTAPAGDKVLVGGAAKRQAVLNPANTFYSVKRIIGKKWQTVKPDAKKVAFEVFSDDHGAAVLQCEHSPVGHFYPEEVSALVVEKLLRAAEAHAGCRVSKAVISVPAYFDERQKEATVQAGMIAGLDSVRLVREPVAAALAYGLDLKTDQTVLVFDLGGGTYDISILEVGGGVVEVLATGGDANLGGDDFDQAIVDWVAREYLRPARVDCTQPSVIANLRALAEYAKVQLSEHKKVVLTLPIGGKDGGGTRAELTRDKFESLTKGLFKRARLPLDQACWQAGTDLETTRVQIDRIEASNKRRSKAKRQDIKVDISPKTRDPISAILLVGGSSKMPAARSFIQNMSGLMPMRGAIDPDQAVALGAAVQAGVLTDEVSDLLVMDVWQASVMRAVAQHSLAQDAQDEWAEDGEGWSPEDIEEWGEEDLESMAAEGEEA